MDTIPSGRRLVAFPPSQQATLRRTNATEAKNLLVQIENLLRLYNARVGLLPTHERASLNLTVVHHAQRLDGTAVLIHHDSVAWCATTTPAARSRAPHIGASHYVRPFHPASRAELRAYFLRKGGDPREAWRRFPPADASERAEAERVQSGTRTRRPVADPFERLVAKRAKATGRSPTDPAFRASIKAEQDALETLLEGLI
jgi:hypothetical protein